MSDELDRATVVAILRRRAAALEDLERLILEARERDDRCDPDPPHDVVGCQDCASALEAARP